jgi:hypothetical protein
MQSMNDQKFLNQHGAPVRRRQALGTVGVVGCIAASWLQAQAWAQAALADPKITNWAAALQLSKAPVLVASNSLALQVPGVALAGSLAVSVSSEIPNTKWLVLFMQTANLTYPEAVAATAAPQAPPPVSAQDRQLVAAFNTSHFNAKPEFSLPVQFDKTSRFYLIAITPDAGYVVEAETKLAKLKR